VTDLTEVAEVVTSDRTMIKMVVPIPSIETLVMEFLQVKMVKDKAQGTKENLRDTLIILQQLSKVVNLVKPAQLIQMESKRLLIKRDLIIKSHTTTTITSQDRRRA
jgi:hypothetical protein